MRIVKPMRTETVHVGFRVSVDLKQRLEALARESGRGVTMTDVVQQLLVWALARHEAEAERKKASRAAVALDARAK